MRRVTIFHNVATDHQGRHLGMLDGYGAGHPVIMVARYETEASDPCDEAYFLFNVGHDPEFGKPSLIAQEYRFRGNRSLSVGDVVEYDRRYYACASAGWEPIDRPHILNLHGTAPMDMRDGWRVEVGR